MMTSGKLWRWLYIGGLLGITAVLTLLNEFEHTAKVQANRSSGTAMQFLPLITNGDPLYCRFGVNANQTFDNYQIDDLPIGWYVNYQAMVNPERPNGASYALIISLTQTGPNANDYDYNPNGADLIDAIAGNPGC